MDAAFVEELIARLDRIEKALSGIQPVIAQERHKPEGRLEVMADREVEKFIKSFYLKFNPNT